MNDPVAIRRLVGSAEIAVIGLSADPARASHYVSAYMQSTGARIIPINPTCDGNILGERCLSSLEEITTPPALVNVFRLPRFLPAIVDQMIQLRFPAVWVQSGIVDLASARRAEAAGITVVMDRCLMVEHRAALASQSQKR